MLLYVPIVVVEQTDDFGNLETNNKNDDDKKIKLFFPVKDPAIVTFGVNCYVSAMK